MYRKVPDVGTGIEPGGSVKRVEADALRAFRVSLESAEVEEHAALALDPGVVAGRHVERLARADVQLAAVVHPDGHRALENVADVLDLAAVGAAQRLHVLRPAPAGLERAP